MTKSAEELPELASTWYGVLVLQGRRVVHRQMFPDADRTERARGRRAGEIASEERAMLDTIRSTPHVTRDRRLAEAGALPLRPSTDFRPSPTDLGVGSQEYRSFILESAEAALRAAWDPSIHVEEAVRSLGDLDEVKNLLGERLVSWGSRDLPDPEDAGTDGAEAMARALRDGRAASDATFAPSDPELVEARRSLARLHASVEDVRATLEASVVDAMPKRAPNVSALVGPLLAARLLSQAGGLDRLARLPSSTIQVLGAEKAFFEHLRGRAPPPRHGLLFLHPTIQGAPRRMRGKLARALAGKVAIAARLDREGAPLRPELKLSYDARQKAVRSAGPGRRASTKPRSGLPLDRAPEDG